MKSAIAVIALALALPSIAAADEIVYQLVSQEDASQTDPSVCTVPPAPGTVRAIIGATFSSVRTRANDAGVLRQTLKPVGRGTACLDLPAAHLSRDGFFPPGESLTIYGTFEIDGVRLEGAGTCTYQSNDVPAPGVVLAACMQQLTSGPPGFVGGVASSNSVFNPLRLPGYSTGSYWTLRIYTADE